jgi:hypothetical protein
MALADTVTGDGDLVSAGNSARVYLVQESDELGVPAQRYAELVETEVREWVALTQAAAEAAKLAAIQPDDGGVYQYQVDEVSRQTQAFKLVRTWERKTAYLIPDVPEQAATPVFDPPAGEAANPVSVEVTCATPNAAIRYTTTGDDPTFGDAAVVSGSSVSVPVPGTLKAKAWALGYLSSDVAEAAYTLET